MHLIPIFQIILKRHGSLKTAQRQLRHSRDAAEMLREYLRDVDREHFVLLALNRKHRVLGIHTVSMGSLTASIVHPREVMKFLILANAAAFICGHNHPSGDINPSSEDRALTRRLQQVARLCDIQLLDHVIIGDGTDQYMSFADDGLLQYEELSVVSSPT